MEEKKESPVKARAASATQVISVWEQILTNQAASEKVAATVATFLKKERNGFQKMSVKTIQEEWVKVTDMVGTF
jgi:hypothetical protein